MDTIAWNLIDKYFKDNPYNLVAHHLDSYNDFFSKGIFQIFRENNPIRFIERNTETSDTTEETIIKKTKSKAVKIGDKENPNECLIFLGGKDGSKIYFGKPIIYDDENSKPFPHYMYPNDARLRNMTYGVTIHYDIDVDYIYYNGEQKIQQTKTYEKIYLGRFPIMLHSNLCILRELATEARFNMGECRNDYGGYFIISGKEKVIVSQEKFGDNMLYVRKYKEDELYSFSCEIHSVSEDSSKPIRYTSAKIIAPSASYTNNQIVIDIPNVKKPIPLFILMRALGVISDKSIIEHCLLDLNTNSNMVDLFIPSIHDANNIFTQQIALEFIAKFTKRQTISAVQDILMNYFLPHIGEDNYLNKAYFIGFMVNKLLRVFMGKEAPTDRDNFKFKRIETSGTLIYDLFREYYLIQNRNIFLKMDKEYYYHSGKYRTNFVSLVEDNIKEFFKERIVEDGFKKGFKGNWGADANTKRLGLVQDLNRLSWFTHISHLRKISLPLDPTAKIVGPHLLHSTQWGLIDPVDTPDGGNIGLHKHLSISTAITNGFSSYPIIKWIRANTSLKLLTECSPNALINVTKVFVNGNWIGVLDNPIQTINNLKLFRRNGIIPVYTSISFSYESNIIYIYTDGGRLTRPIFYRDQIISTNGQISYNKLSYEHGNIKEIIQSRKYTWTQVISGFEKKNDEFYNVRNNILYDVNTLYPGYDTLEKILEFFERNRAIIDYIDTSEEESAFISNTPSNLKENKYYTHCEIDPSLIFGVMGNSIIYPETNQFPRDCFSCGQSRQAVSVYHSNSQMRMDKMGVVLNYGQTPLIKSRYLEYINHEEQPYGVNAIVAIMSYTGYNVEDAILINEASVKRGIFRTTYYTTYEAREESSKVSGSSVNTTFANIENKPNVKGIKEGFDYSKLDKYGIVQENIAIDERIVLIGEVTSSVDQRGTYNDNSKTTKKGQLGFVDKSFISEGEEGFRIAKVRIREERLPAIGDKMASRAGQKGTLGLIIPEEDMPFTADGVRPDLIINPHAIPSRMTIGQLVESLFGKACCMYGGYGDCTAFATKGSNYDTYGHMLTKMGYHNSGNQILYSGFTGEQLYSEIFIGPTYYMRLKHMVKDKINYRATGKRNFLTRQTNQGRANDGGLKLGEMERDGIMAHGLSYFLNESYMVRGDQYFMGVCNKTGSIAVYNPDTNLFLSPFADGPLVFNKNVEGQQVLNAISKFGRSFSIIRIPFALKLLIQELQVMNIQMRIITEDNIDQLMNLSYQSRNIDKLLHIDQHEVQKEVKEIVENYKIEMESLLNDAKNNKFVDKYGDTGVSPRSLEYTPEYSSPDYDRFFETGSPDYAPGSPGYIAPGSPGYIAPGSPGYIAPGSPGYIAPGSPGYIAPGSPGYIAPGSPGYIAPGSPGYIAPGSPGYIAPGSPGYAPGSPGYIAPGSPGYAPGSPGFSQGSPVYAPSHYYPGYSPASSQGSINIDDLLVNKQPTKNWEISPPYVPNFNDKKTEAQFRELPLYVQDNISKLNIMDKDVLDNVVYDTYNRYVTQQTGVSPHTPDFSPPSRHTPEDAPPLTGGANVFNNPLFNNEFNKLDGAQQSKILQLPPEQRGSVMSEIIRRSSRGGNSEINGGATLNKAFNALPVHNQVLALQNGYNSMAKEFNSLAKHVPETLTTFKRPVPVSVELANKFPLLAVEGGNNKNTSSSTKSDNETSSSSSTNNDSDSYVKKITI
jgi:DNA-directed RNA polymerase II subunit RPB2